MTLKAVLEKIQESCDMAGRPAKSVRLIAVSKTKPIDAISNVFGQGQRDFGENYVDELIDKAKSLCHLEKINWVFIGQLQSNKIQKLVQYADEIQTISTEKHARYIDRYAGEFGKKSFPVWIQINAGNEDQKFGATKEQIVLIGEYIKTHCKNLVLKGIMAIPPANYSDESYRDQVPALYVELSQVAKSIGEGLISIGMSSDLKIAINSGSDCVRIGTAVFGAR